MAPSRKQSAAKSKSKPLTLSANTKVRNCREYGEDLVGSKVRVWWPKDREFYKGSIDSFDSSRKRHRVLYDDGEEEVLDMKRQKWELVESDDDKEDKIPQKEDSGEESSEATPEKVVRKNAKRNGKSAVEEKPKKKSVAKKAEKAKAVVKPTPKAGKKPEAEKNGKMGDVGGKIVAAASRMSGRLVTKENGKAKETSKPLRSKTKALVKPRKSSKATQTDNSDDDVDASSEDEAIETSKQVAVSNKLKQKRPFASAAEAVVPKKRRTSSTKVESDKSDDEEGGSADEGDGEGSSDEEDKPLAEFMKKTPQAVEALKEKLKEMKEKAAEGSSEAEAEEDAEVETEEAAEKETEAEKEAEAEEEAEKEAGAEEEAGKKAEAEEEAEKEESS